MTYRQFDEYLDDSKLEHLQAIRIAESKHVKEWHAIKASVFMQVQKEFRKNFRKLDPHFNDEF
jgi:hypothetical protein